TQDQSRKQGVADDESGDADELNVFQTDGKHSQASPAPHWAAASWSAFEAMEEQTATAATGKAGNNAGPGAGTGAASGSAAGASAGGTPPPNLPASVFTLDFSAAKIFSPAPDLLEAAAVPAPALAKDGYLKFELSAPQAGFGNTLYPRVVSYVAMS